jgi:hypothetical protein
MLVTLSQSIDYITSPAYTYECDNDANHVVEENKSLLTLVPCGLDRYDTTDRKRTAKNDDMRIRVGVATKEGTRKGRHGLLVKKEKKKRP